jgi:hypothetical protein
MAFVEFCEYGIDFWIFGQKKQTVATMWIPTVISWFINTSKYSYLRTINRNYWSCVHWLSYHKSAINPMKSPFPHGFPMIVPSFGGPITWMITFQLHLIIPPLTKSVKACLWRHRLCCQPSRYRLGCGSIVAPLKILKNCFSIFFGGCYSPPQIYVYNYNIYIYNNI